MEIENIEVDFIQNHNGPDLYQNHLLVELFLEELSKSYPRKLNFADCESRKFKEELFLN